MKKIISVLILIIIFLSSTTIAQAPQAFKYQTVVRDNSGNVLINQQVSFRMSILYQTASGLPVYIETHDTVTNQAGLVNLDIGTVNVEYGDFQVINWRTGEYFLETALDTAGGSNYQVTGATQMLSVPFTLYSDLAGGMVLTDEKGNQYQIGIDTLGNLVTSSLPGWECGDILIDERDGQQYTTVAIGTQCWMAENLNTGIMIQSVTGQQNNDTIEKCCYNNDIANCDEYGGLYQWDEMMQYISDPGTQGICPPAGGWHLPDTYEWCSMEYYLDTSISCEMIGLTGTDVGGKLKETGTTHWMAPNTGASNSS